MGWGWGEGEGQLDQFVQRCLPPESRPPPLRVSQKSPKSQASFWFLRTMIQKEEPATGIRSLDAQRGIQITHPNSKRNCMKMNETSGKMWMPFLSGNATFPPVSHLATKQGRWGQVPTSFWCRYIITHVACTWLCIMHEVWAIQTLTSSTSLSLSLRFSLGHQCSILWHSHVASCTKHLVPLHCFQRRCLVAGCTYRSSFTTTGRPSGAEVS